MSKRRKSRLLAIETLYAYHLGVKDLNDIKHIYKDWDLLYTKLPLSVTKYAIKLLEGTLDNIHVIDDLIIRYTVKKDFRYSPVVLSILQVSIYSILHQQYIPKPVVISEAVEIALKLAESKSHLFVNALLEKIALK